MLAPSGRIVGDFTVTCIDDNEFQLTASYAAQAMHMRWFESHLDGAGVRVENVSDSTMGFQIAGPNSRELLSRATRADVGGDAFKFMDVKRINVGLANALVQRLTFTGDLGYEIFVEASELRSLYDRLALAGEDLGLRPFGMRAIMSMRLDKFYGSWLREYSPDYTPGETGLDRFVSWKKNSDFIGRDAAESERAAGAARRLVYFEVDALDADVFGYEPVWIDGKVEGFCTSGGYSHYAGKSIAYGFVPSHLITDDLEVEIEILGEMRPARRLLEPLLDPAGLKMTQ